MPKILAVEDEPQIIQAIEKAFSLSSSFVLTAVSDPDKALARAIREKPDLILLDVKFPGGDGRIILKQLKKNASTAAIPVIFLTGMSSEGDKVVGLNLGADDYLVKPFGAMELLARVQAVLRRYQPKAGLQGSVRLKGLCLDPQSRRADLDGKLLRLQPKEFEILYLLASHPGQRLSRTFLIENSSSYGLPVATRSLDTHIKNIRKKLGRRADLIETVPTLGYRFAADV